MSETRHHAHELIDRLPEAQLTALVGLLETIVDPGHGRFALDAPSTTSRKPNMRNWPSPKRATGFMRTAARAFLMPMRCDGLAWSEGD